MSWSITYVGRRADDSVRRRGRARLCSEANLICTVRATIIGQVSGNPASFRGKFPKSYWKRLAFDLPPPVRAGRVG